MNKREKEKVLLKGSSASIKNRFIKHAFCLGESKIILIEKLKDQISLIYIYNNN